MGAGAVRGVSGLSTAAFGRRIWRQHRVARPAIGLLLAAIVVSAFALHITMPAWYARWWYPLEHAETIVTEAREAELDPALVAAVIYQESKFEPGAESSRGAVGLMQVLPATAAWIHGQPGAPEASPDRLAEPQVNIAYGTWYLRYLHDRYGSDTLALAAYNGGETNVQRWIARAGPEPLRVSQIPFGETRGFVDAVLHARTVYRDAWSVQLGS